MFDLWLSLKLMRGGGKFLGVTAILSVVGLVIGVGVLIATMAVVSGFEKTVRNSVIDLSGHVVLMKRGTYLNDLEQVKVEVLKLESTAKISPFIHLEAMVPVKGKVSGVMIQGIDSQGGHRIENLSKRVVEGKWDLSEGKLVIGKEFAKRMGVSLGDTLKIVIPRPSKTNSQAFSPKLKSAEVSGFIDLGKFEYNDRIVMADNRLVQSALGLKQGTFSGIRIMLPEAEMATKLSHDLSGALRYPYYTRNWYQLNQNFFKALEIEKMVIFIVLSVMVLAASFNTASSLFISVVKRYSEIAVLKAIGAGPGQILKIFSIQGLLIGFIGTLLGILFGFFLIYILQNYSLVNIPADIYKIDKLPVDLRATDLALVATVSFVLTFLASLIPAYRGSKLSPMEGLRYE